MKSVLENYVRIFPENISPENTKKLICPGPLSRVDSKNEQNFFLKEKAIRKDLKASWECSEGGAGVMQSRGEDGVTRRAGGKDVF